MTCILQIAYYRQFKKCVPTYESCSTAAFKHGRTETIRPASRATKLCAEAFEANSTAKPEELMQLITQATNHHSKLVKEAALGKKPVGIHTRISNICLQGRDLIAIYLR